MEAATQRKPRIALVLGSGGIVGGAYHAGVLKALNDTWDIDARTVDLIVGTSAGSIAGAIVAAGLHPNDLFRRETGKPLSPRGRRTLTRARAERGPKPNPKSTFGYPAAPEVLFNALMFKMSHHRVALGSVAAALLPRGEAGTDHVAGMVHGLLGDSWPSSLELRVCAVELSTGRRVVFGASDGSRDFRVASPGQAVAASCAVPAVFAPVKIGDREYLDGGAHSADNLDIIGTDHYDLVIVSSPMSTDRRGISLSPSAAIRELSRTQTDRERHRLTNCGHIEILRPNAEDRDAMGSNLLDPRRRPAVAYQAHASACAQLSRRASPV